VIDHDLKTEKQRVKEPKRKREIRHERKSNFIHCPTGNNPFDHVDPVISVLLYFFSNFGVFRVLGG